MRKDETLSQCMHGATACVSNAEMLTLKTVSNLSSVRKMGVQDGLGGGGGGSTVMISWPLDSKN